MVNCGYRIISGFPRIEGGTVAVVPMIEAYPLGLAGPLANEVARRLAAGGARVVGTRDGADFVMQGEITGGTTSEAPIPGGSGGIIAPSFQVGATAHVVVIDRSGTEIWRASVEGREDFLLVPSNDAGPLSAVAVENNRQKAISRLASTLATAITDRLMLTERRSTAQE